MRSRRRVVVVLMMMIRGRGRVGEFEEEKKEVVSSACNTSLCPKSCLQE
jgi:hypothetical protein